jgi:hypothetical protein
MKNGLPISLLMVAVGFICVNQPVFSQPGAVPNANAITVWEYYADAHPNVLKYGRSGHVGTEITGELTRSLWFLGQRGWELVAVVPGQTVEETRYFFKRPAGSGRGLPTAHDPKDL